MNIDPSDLSKLSKVPLIVAIIGVLVNLLLLSAITNNAWLEGVALADGQPFQVHLSLGSAIFGPNDKPNRDTKYFCDHNTCSLHELCSREVPPDTFPNGMPKYTSPDNWCAASSAGRMVGGLLGCAATDSVAARFADAVRLLRAVRVRWTSCVHPTDLD